MSKTSIEWTDDTWNPVSGCTRVSAGCDHCYAVTMTKRLEAMGKPKYAGLVNIGKAHFNGTVRCHAAGVPFFFKQWGAWLSKCQVKCFGEFFPYITGETRHAWTNSEFGALTLDGEYTKGWTPFSDEVCVRKVGKRLSGRILDGRTWDEFPEVAR